ncbi:MAG: DUF7619 domain-containing protein [Bacteroidales bacterium]
MKKIQLFLIAMFAGLALFAQDTKNYHTSPDTIPLPDGYGVSYTSTLFVTGYAAGETLNDVSELTSICVNMEHSYMGDLVITITAPDGNTVTLQEQGGGGTHLGEPIDNGTNDNNSVPGVGYDYCWSPFAENGTWEQESGSDSILPPGSYTSSEPLSNLTGSPLNGLWTLTISDNWQLDDGYLFHWGINFTHNQGCFNMITGHVFGDINGNNSFDSGEPTLSGMIVKAEPGPFYGYTDANGQYRIWVDSADYTISLPDVSAPWMHTYPAEPGTHDVYVEDSEPDTLAGYDFGLQADTYCPNLSVDVVMDNPILCSDGNIYIHYINNGTTIATDPTIDITLDDNLSYISGGNLLSQDGNTLTFGLPDLGISESGQFVISAQYACDGGLLGATACVDAHIYPDDPCEPVDSSWDHSSVMVEGECLGDSLICFTITNTGDPGDGDMAGTSDYRLFEDNVLIEDGTFQLNGGEIMQMCWAATGTTLRLEADQRPGHPGNSHPQESIELCGSPENSMGQVMSVPQDDADDFAETDCQEVLGSYDPNDKSVTPVGITEDHHYIDSTHMLEYKIRFQNTGTAPAQKVVIIDTISPHLDIESFQHMSASHECTVDILYDNLMRWTFENINLPDSGSNEPASHGYVKFKISQQPGNELYTMITNGSSIFFDYNLPILTNEVFNTIGRMDVVYTADEPMTSENKVQVYPNPAQDYINFSTGSETWKLELYDASGRIIQRVNRISDNTFRMSVEHLNNGVYYYHISDKNGSISKGKLVINQ